MTAKKTDKKNFETPEEFDNFMHEMPKEDDIEDVEEEIQAPKQKPMSLEEEPVIPQGEIDEPDEMLNIMSDVPVQLVAVMGKKNITIKELSLLRMGEVIELGRPANEIIDLVAGGKLVAKGELVEIEGKLGVRIVKMIR